MPETFETRSAAETEQLGRALAERFGVGDCVALAGELGSGKTVLVRGIALGLGIEDQRLVCSPTYVLVREYAGAVPIFHIDLYRLAEPAGELGELGTDEMLAEGLVLIEWADRAGEALPRPRWQIDIEVTGADRRRLRLERVG
jgi:tRNA threonylcarbamoyladenosine biosynthesis protein TsaE